MGLFLGTDFRIMGDCFLELPDSCFPHSHLNLLFPFQCYFWLLDLNVKLSSVFWVWVPTVPSKAGAPGNQFRGTVWKQTTQPLPCPLCWAQHELEGWIPSLSFWCCSPTGQPPDPVRIYGYFEFLLSSHLWAASHLPFALSTWTLMLCRSCGDW